MNKHLLSLLVVFLVTLTAQAQTTVRHYLRLTDNTFNLNLWGTNNSRNLLENTITLGDQWCAAGWDFVGSNIDLTQYDSLVVKIKSIDYDATGYDYEEPADGGSPINFRLRDASTLEYSSYRINKNELSVSFDLQNNEWYGDTSDNPLDLSNIISIDFWDYVPATITIDEIYLVKTIPAGTKDYDTTPFPMTQEGMNYVGDGVVLNEDNWTLNLYSVDNFAGWEWTDAPQDWSAYSYLVVVPQVPFCTTSAEGTKAMQFNLSDGTNTLNNAQFRHFYWNQQRAIVIDLANFQTTYRTGDDAENDPYLSDFNIKTINGLWLAPAIGDITEVDFGISAIYLTNSKPTWSGDGGWGTASTAADYVVSNDASGNFSNICLPYASAVCGAEVYNVKGVDTLANKLVLERHTGILEAGTPYVLRTNCSDNVTIYRAGDGEQSVANENGALIGTFLRKKFTEPDATKAVLDDEGNWNAVQADDRAAANGAYLDLTKLACVTAADDDVTMTINADWSSVGTGINTVAVQHQTDDKIYDLSGRRVSHPTKGIYIRGGKKYVVR